MAARMALPTASTPDADLARSRGYNSDSIRQCQADQRLDVDGDLGPKTRSNIHKALVALTPARLQDERSRWYRLPRRCPVPVMPFSLDAPWWKSKEVSVPVISGGASILTAIGGIPWQNLLIIIIIRPVGLARLPLLPEERRPEVLAKQVEGIASYPAVFLWPLPLRSAALSSSPYRRSMPSGWCLKLASAPTSHSVGPLGFQPVGRRGRCRDFHEED